MCTGHRRACFRKDLVTRLITDNNVVWNELLRNKFCMEMKAADKDNKKVSDGFEWYMKVCQIYFCCQASTPD